MPSPILNETIERLHELFADELDEITIDRAVIGVFFTGVRLSSGHGGLSFTPVKEMPQAVCCPGSAAAMPLSGKLSGRAVREYLTYATDKNVLKRALGVAALNAISSFAADRGAFNGYEITRGVDAFDEIDLKPVKSAVVVGALAPMLKLLIKESIPFHVLEMDIRTLKERELPYYAPPEDAHLYVPDADLLVITGTTLLNDTLEGLLEMAKPGAAIVVTGPTASMLPAPFFKRGVTLLGGVMVTHADEALDIISEAGSGYHFFGKSADRVVVRRTDQ